MRRKQAVLGAGQGDGIAERERGLDRLDRPVKPVLL